MDVNAHLAVSEHLPRARVVPPAVVPVEGQDAPAAQVVPVIAVQMMCRPPADRVSGLIRHA